jgi:Tfp pilus assembly protein FimT
MRRTEGHWDAGFTIIEATVVVAIAAVLVGLGWPLTSRLLDRSELVTAMDALRAEVRAAQREARASGRVVEMRVNPSAGRYVVGPVGERGRVSRLPAGVTFGFPDDAGSDGVTFRDNTVRFSPRTGLQASFGSIALRSRGGARKITVSVTGHTAIARWDGRAWR